MELTCKKNFEKRFEKNKKYKVENIFTTCFTTTWAPITPESERIYQYEDCYVIDGKQYSRRHIDEYFYLVKEERKEKLKRIQQSQ
jgi:hypothetical protein